MTTITIGGLTGCGGRQLGQLVSDRLGSDYVDRLILTGAAREIGSTVEALIQREERPPTTGERISRVLQRVLERSAISGASGDPYFGPGAVAFLTHEYENLPQATITKGHELEDEAYIQGLRNVFDDLAASGNAVIVGRGGSAILRDNPKVLRIGLSASHEDRLSRIMSRDDISRTVAETVVNNRDKARQDYFRRFFDIEDPEAPHQFHISINTSIVSFEYASDLIVQASETLSAGTLGENAAAKA